LNDSAISKNKKPASSLSGSRAGFGLFSSFGFLDRDPAWDLLAIDHNMVK